MGTSADVVKQGRCRLLDNHRPTHVLDHVQALACGGETTWVWLEDNSLLGWGANNYGQLGMSGPISLNAPSPLPALDGMVMLTASYGGACGIRQGTVVCWGLDLNSSIQPPTTLAGLTSVTSLSGNLHYGCARVAGDDVVCWGKNDHGQLGDGTDQDSATPVHVKW